MILGCQNDYIETELFGNYHKDTFGIALVVTDVICILVVTYFIGKVREINLEYIAVIDDLCITMSDYALQVTDLKVDKFS